MKNVKMLFLVQLVAIFLSAQSYAGDFDWIKGFNLEAERDSSGFKTRLETRFKIGDADLNVVLGNVEEPSDAYMVLKMGELSGRPIANVMDSYKASKGKGWGVVAKSLGIKPGSSEFRELKANHDLYSEDEKKREKSRKKERDSERSKGRK